jgi:hypothetical protein
MVNGESLLDLPSSIFYSPSSLSPEFPSPSSATGSKILWRQNFMSQRDLPDGFPVVTASFVGSKGGQRVLIGYLGERLNGDQSGA